MVKGIIDKLHIIIGIYLLLICYSCNSQNQHGNSHNIIFKNYSNEEISIPGNISNSELEYNSTVKVITCDIELTNSIHRNKISGKLFELLCRQNVINKWNIYANSEISVYPSNWNEFINIRKKELNLYFIGETELIKSCNSILILSLDGDQDDYNIIRDLYLLNINKDKVLKSITKVSSFYCFDGSCQSTYTQVLKNKTLVQKKEETSTDVILPEEFIEHKVSISKFYYDDDGFLINL